MDGPDGPRLQRAAVSVQQLHLGGTLTNLAKISAGQKAVVSGRVERLVKNELPLDLQVIGFG